MKPVSANRHEKLLFKLKVLKCDTKIIMSYLYQGLIYIYNTRWIKEVENQ